MGGLIRSMIGKRPRAQAMPFAGAEFNRLTADWIFSHRTSADQEVRGSLMTLRSRARDLVRNVPWARRYVQHVANNVIGHKGIRLQARLQGRDGLPLDDQNDAIESAWADWGRAGSCTVDGKYSWLALQRLILETLPADGEGLLRFVRYPNAFGFALQVLDPDQLDETHNVPPSATSNEIRMGVEFNAWGRPVAYWLWDRHPSELSRGVRRRVPAEDIIHIGMPVRVAQTRYPSWLAPVMLDIKMLRGYYEAELVAARVGAAKMGFFVRKGDNPFSPGDAQDGTTEGSLTMDAEPGKMEELPQGVEFQGWSPEHPVAAFEPFTKALLRAIAAGLGTSYSGLTGDLTDVNYSSIRAGILDERDTYRALQSSIIEQVHHRVYRRWVPAAMLAGQLDARVSMDTYLAAATWQPRGYPWVDPQNDISASEKGIALGLTSRTILSGEQGRDFEETLDDLRAEEALAKEFGVWIGGVRPAVGGTVPATDSNNPDATTQADPAKGKPVNRLALLNLAGPRG